METATLENPILEFIRWWEKKRWIFNLLVGFTGLLVSLSLGGLFVLLHSPIFSFIYVVFYGLIANVFYSLGWTIEMIRVAFGKPIDSIGKNRMLLFISGTVFSILLTALMALAAFSGEDFVS